MSKDSLINNCINEWVAHDGLEDKVLASQIIDLIGVPESPSDELYYTTSELRVKVVARSGKEPELFLA